MGFLGFLNIFNKKKTGVDPELKRRVLEYIRNQAYLNHRQVFLELIAAEMNLPLFRVHIILQELKTDGRVEEFYLWKCDQCTSYKEEEYTLAQREQLTGKLMICDNGHVNQVNQDNSFYVGYKIKGVKSNKESR